MDVEDGSRADIESRLALIRASGIRCPETEVILDALLPQVRTTYRRLGGHAADVHRTVLARSGGQLVAHASAVRAYSTTWLIQDVRARAGAVSAIGVAQALARWLSQDRGVDYFKLWFPANDAFAMRTFGRFAREIADPRDSHAQLHAHVVLDTGRRPFSDSTATVVDVATATTGEWREFEEHVTLAGYGPLLCANDLTGEGISLTQLDRRYQELGLTRRRAVLLARVGRTIVGFAMLELSSPGLNLSEYLSAFTPHVTDGHAALRRATRAALLDAARRWYAAEGRSKVLGLVPVAEAGDYEQLGLLPMAVSICWTCRGSQLRKFVTHLERS